MAPAVLRRSQQIRQISRSLSSSISSLSTRTPDSSEPPLVSIFALVISQAGSLYKRSASLLSDALPSNIEAGITTGPISLVKRQDAILAIPTTYKGLNSGPAPGAVVGIILGSVGGFILCLYILLLSVQFVGGRRTVVEEEVITTRKRRSRSHHTVRTEKSPSPPSPHRSPPRASSRRRETIIIEERVRHAPPPPRSPDEVIVMEEEESMVDEDIVEVIEEESSTAPSERPPPPKPAKRESRRSGYRTIDPTEPGGGDRPMRRVSKR